MANLTVANSDVVVGELVTETNSAGLEKQVVSCTVDDGLYKSEAEAAGLDYEVVQQVNTFNGTYVNKVTEEAVNAGISILENQKEADRIIVRAPYLGETTTNRGSSIDVVVDRSKTITIPGKGQKEVPAFTLKVNNKKENIGGTLSSKLKEQLQARLA